MIANNHYVSETRRIFAPVDVTKVILLSSKHRIILYPICTCCQLFEKTLSIRFVKKCGEVIWEFKIKPDPEFQ